MYWILIFFEILSYTIENVSKAFDESEMKDG